MSSSPAERNPSAGNEWVVRDGTADDIAGWTAVQAEVAAEGRWIGAEQPAPADQMRTRFEEAIADPNRLFLVATTEADGVFGGLHAEKNRVGVVEFGMFMTANWRGRGVGTALVQRCISWAIERQSHKVSLQVWPHNAAAIALYEKAGFAREGRLRRHYRRRSGELWDAIIMGLVLDLDSSGSPYSDDEPG